MTRDLSADDDDDIAAFEDKTLEGPLHFLQNYNMDKRREFANNLMEWIVTKFTFEKCQPLLLLAWFDPKFGHTYSPRWIMNSGAKKGKSATRERDQILGDVESTCI